ncbi:MAG: lipocalin family protein [Pontiellaceae bacterium]|nr:lipocalin family protein [Pontiellaceae bacterium]MBN2785236.1 lipocalin family protein [Pontiellaceae bacterium]
MKQMIHLFACFAIMLIAASCRSTSDLKVISGFEVDRYLGTWYEAARFPHRFEKDLVAVTADYSRNPDGTIRVINRGYHPGKNKWETAEGEARFRDDPTVGWLEVSFFKPFYGAYKILYLDKEYTEAIVAGPTYGYFWILTREPELPKERLGQLVRKAADFGFDTNRIEFVAQEMNR